VRTHRRLSVSCVFVGAAALLLAACASSGERQVNKADYKLDASSDRGGVIFGWRIVNPDARAIFYNLVWTCYDPATKLVCPDRDPNSEKNAFGVPQRLNLWGAVRRPDFAAPDTLSATAYQVFMMPPGTYVLRSLTEGLPQPYLPPFLFTPLDSDWVYRFVPAGGLATAGSGPRFKVEAGKMIYVGDLTFDMKTVREGPRVDRNEAGARAAVAEYPNIKVPLRPATSPD
jgi:hypothetical protein